MKNSKHVLIALLAALAAGTASAQSTTSQGYYGEVGYTSLNIKNDDNGYDVTPKLARFIVGKEIDKNLSVEGTYAFTASKGSVTQWKNTLPSRKHKASCLTGRVSKASDVI